MKNNSERRLYASGHFIFICIFHETVFDIVIKVIYKTTSNIVILIHF